MAVWERVYLHKSHFTRPYSHVQHHRVFGVVLFLESGRLEHAGLQCPAGTIRDVKQIHLRDGNIHSTLFGKVLIPNVGCAISPQSLRNL